jgi:alpha-beta hydrolase superfamily lysophospholipase
MKGEFVRIQTSDGIELHGLLCEARKSGPVVIHVHGMAGNFYESRFVDAIADRLANLGITFLTANNRGHGYISHFIKTSQGVIEHVEIGAAHEDFDDSVLDIDAYIEFMKERGHSPIILQGHSTGAAKVADYCARRMHDEIVGAILLSPSDDLMLQRKYLGNRFSEVLDLCHRRIAAGRGDELLPEKYYEWDLIDSKAYLGYFESNSGHTIFHVADEDNSTSARLHLMEVPVLIATGSLDKGMDGPPDAFVSRIGQAIGDGNMSTVHVIEGASHNYLGHEKELARTIEEWIAQRIPDM